MAQEVKLLYSLVEDITYCDMVRICQGRLEILPCQPSFHQMTKHDGPVASSSRHLDQEIHTKNNIRWEYWGTRAKGAAGGRLWMQWRMGLTILSFLLRSHDNSTMHTTQEREGRHEDKAINRRTFAPSDDQAMLMREPESGFSREYVQPVLSHRRN